jgi:hypothetical protein
MLNKLAKPRLTALEACHRLALREGQKENKKNTSKLDWRLKELHEKTAIVLILLITLTLATGLKTSLAQGPTGADPARSDNPNLCCFCECWHDDPGVPELDTMSGIGVSANYDMVNELTPCYNQASWQFDDQAGWSLLPFPDPLNQVAQFTGLECTWCINYNLASQQYANIFDNSAPQWGEPNNATHYCWYVHHDYPDNGPASYGPYSCVSVEGETQAYFYPILCPFTAWGIIVYTTDPSNPGPNSFAYLTAWDQGW